MPVPRWLTVSLLIASCALADDKRPYKEILEDLKSPDATIRMRGIADIAKYPREAPSPCLDMLLKEGDVDVRKTLVGTLVLANAAQVAKEAQARIKKSDPGTAFYLDLFDVFDQTKDKEGLRIAAKTYLTTTQPEVETKAHTLLLAHKRAGLAGLAGEFGATELAGQWKIEAVMKEMGTKDSVRFLIAIGCIHGDFNNEVDKLHLDCRQYLTGLHAAIPYLIEGLGKDMTRGWSWACLRDATGMIYAPGQVDLWKQWWKDNHKDGDDLPDE